MPSPVAFEIANLAQVLKRLDKIKGGIKNPVLLMKGAASFVLREALLTFRKQGAHAGHRRWPRFSQFTLHPSKRRKIGGETTTVGINHGKWNKRPGTDGATTRRYSATSKLLQASGAFRNSFGIFPIRPGTEVEVGTRHELAGKIMGSDAQNPRRHRPVMRRLNEPQRVLLRRIMHNWMQDKLVKRA